MDLDCAAVEQLGDHAIIGPFAWQDIDHRAIIVGRSVDDGAGQGHHQLSQIGVIGQQGMVLHRLPSNVLIGGHDLLIGGGKVGEVLGEAVGAIVTRRDPVRIEPAIGR